MNSLLLEAIEVRIANIEKSVENLVSKDQSTDDFLSVTEAAKLLRLKKSTLYIKTHLKTIPFMKRGRNLLFSKKQLINYLYDGQVKTSN